MKKILILGAYGYLGNALSNFLSHNFEIYRQGRTPISDYCFDPANKNDCKKYIDYINPNIIINLISETDVDKCEKFPDIAREANTIIVKYLIDSIRDLHKDIYFIQISTDQVYSGKGPHKEINVSPLNIYGKTKFDGEKFIDLGKHIVLRTNFIGKDKYTNKINLVDWIVKSLRNKIKINVFSDILFNPLSISSLCNEVVRVINNQKKGVFNLGSNNFISKADLAIIVAKKLNLDLDLLNITSSTSKNFAAKRNKDMRINIQKYEKGFNIKLPNIYKEVERVIEDYKTDGT